MRTGVVIVTGPSGIAVDAKPGQRVTRIDGARIAVIANGGGPGIADTIDAPVTDGTQAAVVARHKEVLDETPGKGVARVGRARVTVVA